jgi:hypothetical protein
VARHRAVTWFGFGIPKPVCACGNGILAHLPKQLS